MLLFLFLFHTSRANWWLLVRVAAGTNLETLRLADGFWRFFLRVTVINWCTSDRLFTSSGTIAR